MDFPNSIRYNITTLNWQVSSMKQWLRRHMPNFRTLQWKFFAMTLFIALCVMMLSLSLCYLMAVRTIRNLAEGYMNEYIQYADTDLGNMIQSGIDVSLTLAMDRELVQATIADHAPEASYPWFTRKKGIENLLAAMIADKPFIEQAVVAVSDGRIYQSGDPLILRRELSQPWFVDTLRSQTLQVYYQNAPVPKVLLCRPVGQGRGIQAVVCLALDYAALMQAYDIRPLRSADVYLYDPEGQLLYTSRTDTLPDAYAQATYWPPLTTATATGYQEQDGARSFIVQYRSARTGLRTVSVISEQALIVDAMHLNNQVAGITMASLALALLASVGFSYVLCRNLRKLTHGMKAVRANRLHTRVSIRSQDEIGELAETFNSMMQRIALLMDDVKREEADKLDAERSVLAAQIQPHFLYNAIGAIQYTANLHGEREIEQAATALSVLLRSVLGKRDAFVTLWEERTYIESYLTIQRFKLQKPCTLLWEVDESLWVMRIPKLLLQPLVENALIHGIAHKEHGTITVKAFPRGEDMILKVMDDGSGMPADVAQRLMTGTPESGSTFRNVGVPNVFTRLTLIYGSRAAYNITSHPGAFTCVELRLPRRTEDSP